MDRIQNLPQPVRYALFGLIAVAVLVLGYLTMTPASDPDAAAPSTSDTAAAEDDTVVVPQPGDPAATVGAPQENPTLADPTDGVKLVLDSPVTADALKVAAGRAVAFTEAYLSYRYDQNPTKKRATIERYLAEENTVDMTAPFPTGAFADRLVASRTVMDVEVSEVAVVMISESMLTLNLTVSERTTTSSGGPDEVTDRIALTLTNGEDGSWSVMEMTLSGAHDHAAE